MLRITIIVVRSSELSTPASRQLDSQLGEQEMRAWQALLHAHEQLVKQLDLELQTGFGLSFNEYDVLLRLVRAPLEGLPMTQLADRVMMPASSLTRVVDRLVERGLVDRRRVEQDARLMLTTLTKVGRNLLRDAARHHLAGIREHFVSRLRPDQLRELAEILETITGPHQPH
jgi:DNA-binding MarR family transcriptional regulator